MKYELNRLNPNEFEDLIQSLLKKIIGQGTITFGPGRDGGREATYDGSAPYPSETNRWKGRWIFQAKFHNTYQNVEYAKRQVIKELKQELEKITKNFPARCDKYILATNVSLSSVKDSGTLDKIDQVKSKFRDKISNIHVWGCHEICRFLDEYDDIRKTYSQFITTGDALNALIQGPKEEARRKHQNEDIKNIFERWLETLNFTHPVQHLSSYPPCFEDFYSQILNQIQVCDPCNEALMHLKTGYSETAFRKYTSLENKIIKHNGEVARYVINKTKDIKDLISKNIPSLKACSISEGLVPNSYYLSNVIAHLCNIASGSTTTTHTNPERVKGVDCLTLYSNGGIRLAAGSEGRIAKLDSLLQNHSEHFTKAYKKIQLSLEEIDPPLSDFLSCIDSLIPQAKHGHLKGQCEFEEIGSN
jgi:hypothetical protein